MKFILNNHNIEDFIYGSEPNRFTDELKSIGVTTDNLIADNIQLFVIQCNKKDQKYLSESDVQISRNHFDEFLFFFTYEEAAKYMNDYREKRGKRIKQANFDKFYTPVAFDTIGGNYKNIVYKELDKYIADALNKKYYIILLNKALKRYMGNDFNKSLYAETNKIHTMQQPMNKDKLIYFNSEIDAYKALKMYQKTGRMDEKYFDVCTPIEIAGDKLPKMLKSVPVEFIRMNGKPIDSINAFISEDNFNKMI